ncbi:MAG: electron transfer flavoprotein subunit alpha/FixB family protein [Candidatus Metalachnospira sp.]|nr:electron transfer flavoprotein subunit alpha/FixB family protein [Candidatus Metalachnospira sp.]
MSKNILVYVEAAEGKAKNVGLEILTPARIAADGGEVIAAVIGSGVADAAKQAIAFGADKAVVVDAAQYEVYNTDVYVNALVELVKKYAPAAVFVGATPDGKDLAPKAAAKLGSGCVANVTGVAVEDGKIVYTSPVYAGAILNDAVCESDVEFAVLRSGAFKKAESDVAKTGEIITEAIECAADAIKAKIIDVVKEISETVNLEEADVIVAGGRGVGNAENFAILKELADALGGVIGATRAPIEAGWISRAYQIGQSGKSVAPKLYIACGISGATQHVAGITGADFIVAINKDEDASIFEIANVGIVGNLLEVVPVLTAEVKKFKS